MFAPLYEHFADTLRNPGYTTCKTSPDVWMCPTEDCDDYIAVDVDDLVVVAKYCS